MNELEIRKIAKEEFMNNVMDNIDSTLIFTYIRNLERKVNHLQSKIDKTNDMLQLLHYKFKDEDSIHNEIEDIQNVLKEDK